MFRVFLILARNDLRSRLRSKAGIFWAFVFPILLLTVMLLAFGRSDTLGTVRLVFDGDTLGERAQTCQSAIEAAFGENGPVRASASGSRTSTAADDIVRITWPSHASEPVRVTYPFAGSLPAKAAARIVEIALVRCEAAARGMPAASLVRFENDLRAQPAIDYGGFFVTGILVMAFMSIGVMSGATEIATLRERNAFKMYACFPVPRFVFLASLIASRMVLMLASATTLVVVSKYGFGLPLPLASVHTLRALPVALLGAAMLLAFGTLLASRARTLAEVELWCNVTYYPLLFFGDLTIPLTAAPEWLRSALRVLPTNAFAVALRGVFIGEASYAQVAWPLAGLIAWTLVFLILATVSFRWHHD
ncbi:MAG TPA: ABC transporter permease [Trinickia sp.]|nr:ABC transporter permease [Trinickia sp.]